LPHGTFGTFVRTPRGTTGQTHGPFRLHRGTGHGLERHLAGSTIGIVTGVTTHSVMHPGSTFTHFGHDVAHTVFTAFMAAHRRFATVSRVPLFAHARSRGGLALATATASFDGAIEQRTIVAGSAFGAKADVVSAQAGTAAIVQTHVFFTGQTTTARWAMASTVVATHAVATAFQLTSAHRAYFGFAPFPHKRRFANAFAGTALSLAMAGIPVGHAIQLTTIQARRPFVACAQSRRWVTQPVSTASIGALQPSTGRS